MLCPAVYAWGPLGHRIVAAVAERHLTLRAAANISRVLDGHSIVQISTWGDEVRSDDRYLGYSVWHYLDLPVRETHFEKGRYMARGHLAWAIDHMLNILKHRVQDPLIDEQEALKWLVHLVADGHQPLHVGYKKDLGGNRCTVVWFHYPSNLHRIWDSQMIRLSELDYASYARFIDFPTKAQIDTWQATPLLVWLHQSHDRLKLLYPEALQQQCVQGPIKHPKRDKMLVLGYRYAYEHRALLQRCLLEGGIRLAGYLNAIYG